MCVKINVKVATSSVNYGGFPLNILLILLKMKINNDHFLKFHIFKYHNLVFWLFILTGHILVKTVPSSLSFFFCFLQFGWATPCNLCRERIGSLKGHHCIYMDYRDDLRLFFPWMKIIITFRWTSVMLNVMRFIFFRHLSAVSGL